MKIEQEKSLLPSVSEFLSIYPPLSKTRASIIDSKKLLIYFHELNLKKQNIEEKETEKIINSTPILISKILKQQKNNNNKSKEKKIKKKVLNKSFDAIGKDESIFSNDVQIEPISMLNLGETNLSLTDSINHNLEFFFNDFDIFFCKSHFFF